MINRIAHTFGPGLTAVVGFYLGSLTVSQQGFPVGAHGKEPTCKCRRC